MLEEVHTCPNLLSSYGLNWNQFEQIHSTLQGKINLEHVYNLAPSVGWHHKRYLGTCLWWNSNRWFISHPSPNAKMAQANRCWCWQNATKLGRHFGMLLLHYQYLWCVSTSHPSWLGSVTHGHQNFNNPLKFCFIHVILWFPHHIICVRVAHRVLQPNQEPQFSKHSEFSRQSNLYMCSLKTLIPLDSRASHVWTLPTHSYCSIALHILKGIFFNSKFLSQTLKTWNQKNKNK